MAAEQRLKRTAVQGGAGTSRPKAMSQAVMEEVPRTNSSPCQAMEFSKTDRL
jgi:hypothetical protein